MLLLLICKNADQKEATAPAPQQTNNDVTATDSKPEPKQEEQQQGFDAENYSGFMYGSGMTPNLERMSVNLLIKLPNVLVLQDLV